jgi:hypothetical protein
MFWIGSGRAAGIDPDVAAKFLLFLPWQMLGVTVCKLGLDQWILANGHLWGPRRACIGSREWRRCSLAICLYCLILSLVFPLVIVLLAAITIFLDVASAIFSAELGAHQKIEPLAVAGALRYPLLFLALIALGQVRPVQGWVLWGLFLGTACCRLAWLLWCRRGRLSKDVHPLSAMELALQQALNFGLYRSDQLAYAVIGQTPGAAQAWFVFLTRFPEIVASAIVSVGPVLYPRLRLANPTATYSAFGVLGPTSMTLLCIVGLIPIWLAFLSFGGETWKVDHWGALGVLMSAALVLPSSCMVYRSLRTGRVVESSRRLALANSIGLLCVGVMVVAVDEPSTELIWAVVIQQIAFLMMSSRDIYPAIEKQPRGV